MISVIMGIYNCEGTLSEAIDSILHQTYSDWELIMCDDGSADHTLDIAYKYQAMYPNKIKVIKNKKNMGLNYTLNNCLKIAKGEFIARMDGDDISTPDRFEKEINILLTHPEYAVVSCPMIYFDENGEWATGKATEIPKKEQLVFGGVHCHAPCIVRSDVMKRVQGYTVDKRLLRVEDWHLWIKIYAMGEQGYNLQEPLYKMRDGRDAINRRKFRYRLNEARVSAYAVKTFKLPISYYLFSFRPIILGIVPRNVYKYLHHRKLMKNSRNI